MDFKVEESEEKPGVYIITTYKTVKDKNDVDVIIPDTRDELTVESLTSQLEAAQRLVLNLQTKIDEIEKLGV